ncbi:MAG: galactose mutarotase [Bacteroidia bacterium]|nr:galactose mutarotase [Bacteroidia bacterium]
MKTEVFGSLPNGKEAHLFTLSNDWMEVKITNYGGTICSIEVPDREGRLADVIFGFDSLEGCLSDHPFMNTLIGRFGNRVAKGQFSIGNESFQLPVNLPPHHLHGGDKGFDKVLWEAQDVSEGTQDKLKLSYLSPDGEMGYPGKLQVEVVYSLTPENELVIAYKANTDAPTHVNLTHHAYFNLKGSGDIRDHELQIDASQIVAADGEGIPLQDALMKVDSTPFDFRSLASLGKRLSQPHEQLSLGGGFDRSFVFDDWDGSYQKVAEVQHLDSGRKMEVFTTEPAVQLYTANFLDGVIGKGGQVYKPYSAFCLETQHFPDSPNRDEFPTTLLRPDQVYLQKTAYKFDTLD